MNKHESPQTVAFYTLGCKTNQLESSTIAGTFRDNGWDVVPFDDPASVYVINTCTVTERSDNEAHRVIRRARLSNPEARIAVTGCYAQIAPELLAAEKGVDYVIGNNFKDQVFRIVEETPRPERPLIQVSDIDKSRILEGASASAIGRTRGSLKIQDGCDYKCTYCIIWEARGLSRSLPVSDIRVQLERMVAEGFREIMLTGINIGQYQHESPDQKGNGQHESDGGTANLADLLEALIAVPGDFRLRLTSLDPMEVDERLIEVMANSEAVDAEGRPYFKICPHVHLSAQSAEDTVLKRMARRHHVDAFIRVCEGIKARMPHASLGSDIIVGFPGETDEAFEKTFDVLSRVPMDYFHVFSYSKRRGTPAASFPDQVPERVKKERAHRLTALSEAKHLDFRREFIGKTLQVIVEEGCEKGMSENYLRVDLAPADFEARVLQPNDLVTVEITDVTPEKTWGRVLEVSPAPVVAGVCS